MSWGVGSSWDLGGGWSSSLLLIFLLNGGSSSLSGGSLGGSSVGSGGGGQGGWLGGGSSGGGAVGAASGAGGSGGGLAGGGWLGGCGSGGGGWNISGGWANRSVVLDTELGGVLVLASTINDQLNTIAGGIGLQSGAWGPLVGTRVLNALNNGAVVDDVLSWTTEEEDRNSSLSSWVPGDLEWLADRDLLVQSWSEDWVALWLSNWWSIGRGDSNDCGKEGGD